MKELERREMELLERFCNQENISIELAKALIKTSKRLSYENLTTGARIKEYDDIIKFHSNNK